MISDFSLYLLDLLRRFIRATVELIAVILLMVLEGVVWTLEKLEKVRR